MPTLFETCLQCYGRHCITTLIENSAVKFEISDEHQQIKLTQRKDSLLRNAKNYVHECMIVSIRSELLKFVLDQILHLKLECFDSSLNILSISCPEEKAEVLWKIVRDFLIIYGGEGILELDFSYVMKSNFLDHLDNGQPKLVLSQTVFRDYCWSKCLVSLKLPNLWNAEIIEEVACYCHNLQHLDITSRYLDQPRYDLRWPENPRIASLGCLYGLHYRADGIFPKENNGCPKLRTLALPQWGGHLEVIDHVVKMIQFMPDLHVVKNVDTRLVAVKYVNVLGSQCRMKFTEFEEWDKRSCRGQEHEVVNGNLCALFPKVKRYASYCCNYGLSPVYYDQGLLKIKNNFPLLEVIEVNKDNPELLEDINFVDPMPNVRIFKLYESDDNIGIDEIQALSATFPNLEKLILYTNCYFCDCDDDTRFDVLFRKLDTLELNRVAELDVSFLRVVLEKCPELRTLELYCTDSSFLYLGEEDPITDEFIQELSVSMKYLEKVTFARDLHIDCCPMVPGLLRLTNSSVQTILSACPNLRCLGDLGEWSVTKTEITLIMNLIIKNNWDLDLVYTSPFSMV